MTTEDEYDEFDGLHFLLFLRLRLHSCPPPFSSLSLFDFAHHSFVSVGDGSESGSAIPHASFHLRPLYWSAFLLPITRLRTKFSMGCQVTPSPSPSPSCTSSLLLSFTPPSCYCSCSCSSSYSQLLFLFFSLLSPLVLFLRCTFDFWVFFSFLSSRDFYLEFTSMIWFEED
jgi:hypothetical protein